jgi:hypothetical protein
MMDHEESFMSGWKGSTFVTVSDGWVAVTNSKLTRLVPITFIGFIALRTPIMNHVHIRITARCTLWDISLNISSWSRGNWYCLRFDPPRKFINIGCMIWLIPHRNHHGHTSRRSCTLMFVSRDSILRCVIDQYRRFWSLNFIVSNRRIPYFVLVNAVHPSHENWHSTAALYPSGNLAVMHRNNRECSQTPRENSSRGSLLASRHRFCSSVRGVCIHGEHD